MRFTKVYAATASLVVAFAAHQGAMAQTGDGDALMALDNGSLRSEIQMRFDAALAASNETGVVAADDTRYIWANEAKAQCGIALGYLKSGTKDPVSVGKCARAYDLMQDTTRRSPITPWSAGKVVDVSCDDPKLIFFPWNKAAPEGEEQIKATNEVISYVAQKAGPCQWNSFEVIGHADLSGTPAYNVKLAKERADYVTGLLETAVPGKTATPLSRGESEPRIPTEDGVREPGNRRVEIRGTR